MILASLVHVKKKNAKKIREYNSWIYFFIKEHLFGAYVILTLGGRNN